jgi:hypothetical protein
LRNKEQEEKSNYPENNNMGKDAAHVEEERRKALRKQNELQYPANYNEKVAYSIVNGEQIAWNANTSSVPVSEKKMSKEEKKKDEEAKKNRWTMLNQSTLNPSFVASSAVSATKTIGIATPAPTSSTSLMSPSSSMVSSIPTVVKQPPSIPISHSMFRTSSNSGITSEDNVSDDSLSSPNEPLSLTSLSNVLNNGNNTSQASITSPSRITTSNSQSVAPVPLSCPQPHIKYKSSNPLVTAYSGRNELSQPPRATYGYSKLTKEEQWQNDRLMGVDKETDEIRNRKAFLQIEKTKAAFVNAGVEISRGRLESAIIGVKNDGSYFSTTESSNVAWPLPMDTLLPNPLEKKKKEKPEKGAKGKKGKKPKK